MATLTFRWHSPILGKETVTHILYPEVGKPPFPVFYLLHGLSDDGSAWLRRSRLEDHARQWPMIVVMPDGYRGFYTDNEQGPAYGRHIGMELLGRVESMLPVARSRRAIGGLSMGGYGALRVGLQWPEKFISINSHSGALGCGSVSTEKLIDTHKSVESFPSEMTRIFGANPSDGVHDLHEQVRRAKRKGRLPKILIDCGKKDMLIGANRAFVKFLKKEKVPYVYREFPGTHDWVYWDTHIREALEFHAKNFGISRNE